MMNDIDVWILTFERPHHLNRLIKAFGEQGKRVNVFSNSPVFQIYGECWDYVGSIIVNNLNTRESNSWCARSWNSIMIQAFQNTDKLVCIQDDTMISSNFVSWLGDMSKAFDWISGPAGDQFFYMTKDVLRQVGWWDERYLGCYCGDADYFKRVYHEYNKERTSFYDTHNWGWMHNNCGVAQHVITTYESKVCADYENQHWALEKMNSANPTLKHSQEWFARKWGIELDTNKPAIAHYHRHENEINWYPWASKKWDIKAYE